MVRKIVSGGQTGADRGGLDAAIEIGIKHGGYAPRGRRAEDGLIPSKYLLEELPQTSYVARTAANVRYSDATLLFVHGKAGLRRSRGTKLTLELCLRHGKPWWVADPRRDKHVDKVVAWIERVSPSILNIAGSRESRARGIQAEVSRFLALVFSRILSG